MLGKWIVILSRLHRINFEQHPWKTTYWGTFQLTPVHQAGHTKVSAPKLHAWLVTVVAEQLRWFLLSVILSRMICLLNLTAFLPSLRDFPLNCYSLEIFLLPVHSTGFFLCFWSCVTAEGTVAPGAGIDGITWSSDGVEKVWVHIRKPWVSAWLGILNYPIHKGIPVLWLAHQMVWWGYMIMISEASGLELFRAEWVH